jgi:hypothetical protein
MDKKAYEMRNRREDAEEVPDFLITATSVLLFIKTRVLKYDLLTKRKVTQTKSRT